MVIPASQQPPYYPPPYPPRRGNGCLWGCPGLIAIFALPVLMAWGYGAWFLYNGFRHDPVMRAASELVSRDGMAHLVLGPDVIVTGIEGNAFSYLPGIGASNAYVLRLQGSRGEGTLAVTAHTGHGSPKIDTMVLTGPDGRHYDLIHHTAGPGGAIPGESI